VSPLSRGQPGGWRRLRTMPGTTGPSGPLARGLDRVLPATLLCGGLIVRAGRPGWPVGFRGARRPCRGPRRTGWDRGSAAPLLRSCGRGPGRGYV
jgi:hypothetical protein